MEKELPIYKDPDYGIEFIVDVDKFEFREKAKPDNRYTLKIMKDLGEGGYGFKRYDKERNDYQWIVVPQFVSLAPEMMAEKYNKAVEEILLLTDFELMVDQEALTRRIKSGELPTIDIEGQSFYVDAQSGYLRPKDDFSTPCISFEELKRHYDDEDNYYGFAYDPRKHEIGKVDWYKLWDFPKI